MKVYGPYTRKKDGRQSVVLYDHELNIRRTMSYPKYVAQEYLGYDLKIDETVDHIDNNFLNNDPSNLRIVSRSEHSADDVLRLEVTIIPCVWCKTPIEVSGKNRIYKKAGPFCSRSCSGKYGKAVQMGTIDLLAPFIPVRTYKSRKHFKVCTSIVQQVEF